MKNLVGMGNALVDVLAHLPSDEMLSGMGLRKGCMSLVDGSQLDRVRSVLQRLECQLCVGGSAGNCVRAFSNLGGKAGFIGSVGDDYYGGFFTESLHHAGIRSHVTVVESHPTGVASTFISSDGERTFGTFLGAAACLKPELFSESLFDGYDYFFIEGYLVQDHELIVSAMKTARSAGTQVCLDLASSNVVAADRDFFHMLLDKYVDIVFANEQESEAMTGLEPMEAAIEMGRHCPMAVVKVGSRGSIIVSDGKVYEAEAVKAEHVVDTTGAGDSYAAGFLYGLSRNCPLDVCARIGSMVASSVIQVVGTTIPENQMQRLRIETENLIG